MTKKHILLIEDNLGDIALFEEAITYYDLNIDLTVIEDGQSSLDYLSQFSNTGYVELPDLIIVDLNLPMVNGKKILEKIKTDQVLKYIPTIIFTTSELYGDLKDCYENNANAYLVKPIDIIEYFETIKIIDTFWLQKCTAFKLEIES